MVAIEAVIAEQVPSSNGWFQLVVPSDGSTVCVKKIVAHAGEGKPVESRDILKKLKSHKVVHGVDINAITHLLELVELNQIPEKPVVIANSDVTQGKDGKLEWCIAGIEDKGSDIVVAPDMPIAILRKAIKGKPGRNVFGKTLQPRPVIDPQLHAGAGIRVEEDADGEFVYETIYAGELKFDDDTVHVDPRISISEDQMCVQMDIPAGHVDGAQQAITEQDILAIFTSMNITHGILVDNIRSALKEQGEPPGFVRNVKVAEGKVAKDGVNARLLVDEHLAVGKLLDNDQIDFHEKSYPWNIKADEIIGQVIPAMPEENGFTVVGKVIQATPAEGASLTLDGIRQETDGKLRALKSGILLVNGSNICVTDSLVVKGDVCHRTGNIHSDQTVIVKGYVEPGFILESKGDVIIQDNVEQSLVRAKGCIVVKSGIRGSQSKIVSRGNINAGFIENARVMALGDLTVENSLVSCYSFCRGKLYIGNSNSKKSTLIGGTTHAMQGIVAANLGSEGFKNTLVSVGANPEVLQKSKKLSEELTKIESRLNELEHLYLQHRQNQAAADNVAMRKIEVDRQSKRQEFELLELEQQKLQALINASRKVTVVIHRHVYPGVRIQILDKSHEVGKKENAGMFFLGDELIIFRPAA